MAKRFTDTNKWQKGFFAELSNSMKLAWIYICDNCNHAGIWDVNLKLLSFHLNQKITKQDLAEAFGSKLHWFDNERKIHIQSFIDFQYGELNQANRVHKSILKILEKEAPSMGLSRGLLAPKDKEKEKEKEKDKEKEKEKLKTQALKKDENTRDLSSAKIGQYFRQRYKAVFGRDYIPWAAKENTIIKRWAASVGHAIAPKLIDAYLLWPDPWVAQRGHTVGLLEQKTTELSAFMVDPSGHMATLAVAAEFTHQGKKLIEEKRGNINGERIRESLRQSSNAGLPIQGQGQSLVAKMESSAE